MLLKLFIYGPSIDSAAFHHCFPHPPHIAFLGWASQGPDSNTQALFCST
jgi:hypothetical protein